MGWWNVDGTDDTVGDRPLDALSEAVAVVVAAYEDELDRRPTVREWEALLTAVLGREGNELEGPVLDTGRVGEVRIERRER